MENINNINLKDIKDNIYVLEFLKKEQIYINNTYYNIECLDMIKNHLNDKLFKKYNYNLNDFNLNNIDLNNIDLNNYLCYNNENSFTLNNKIFNIINFYIFCIDKNKENLYLEILHNNLICICEDKINFSYIFYFKKEIFEELFLKLKLNCKIIIKYLNTKDNIINFPEYDSKIQNTCYKLNNGDIIVKNNNGIYQYINNQNFSYNIKNNLGKNEIGFNRVYNFLKEEILIINCENKINLLDLDFKEEDIKFNNLDKNIYYEKQIKELNEKIKKLEIENNDLKEYNEKFEKLSLFFKN